MSEKYIIYLTVSRTYRVHSKRVHVDRKEQLVRTQPLNDEKVRSILGQMDRPDITVDQFQTWEASLPDTQTLSIDLFGDLFVADGRAILGPFDEITGALAQ